VDLSHRNSPAHRAVADGVLVQVKDHRQRLIASASSIHNQKSTSVSLSPGARRGKRKVLRGAHFAPRSAVRQKHLPGATSFAWSTPRAIFLSGLIVDKYGWARLLTSGFASLCAPGRLARTLAHRNGKDVFGRPDFVARHGPAQGANCRRPAKDFLARAPSLNAATRRRRKF